MPYDLAEASSDSKVTARFSDVITNILTMKMFARQGLERKEFGRMTKVQEANQLNAWNFEVWQITVQGVLFTLLGIAGLYFSIDLWLAGALSTGTAVIVQLYISKLFSSLWSLGRVIKRTIKMLADAQKVVEIFDAPVDVMDPQKPERVRMTHGAIAFTDVAFAYGEGADDVMRDLNLTIPAGQKVGVVGRSGAGKTTITKLLLRFADVTNGAIMIDGQDVRAVTQDDLRAGIAYVPQEPVLFHRSLRENIAYGKADATDAEVEAAAKKAHAHDFIMALPDGYDTLVGERGVKLSGGQRQRVAIARAVLKDAPVMVMDEATSALDSESEAAIQLAMHDVLAGRTAIVVAHRLSTLRAMDRIIVMDEGRIIEDGTHEELVAHGGVYADLWTHQSGGFVK